MAALEPVERELRAAYDAGAIPDDDGRQVPIEPDGIDEADGRALADLVEAEAASRTIEVGFALGLSCLHICSGLMRAGAGGATHVAIDPTEEAHWRNAGRRLVERAGLEETVELIPEESQVALPRLFAQGRRFDLAWVDGDHRFDPAFVDLFWMHRLVEPGGLILVDDMWMPALRVAVAYFEANLAMELLSDAFAGAFRWERRRRRSPGVRPGSGRVAVLRTPDPPVDRPWDHFVEFV
jgi:predicted O-methyltransferase YrrM